MEHELLADEDRGRQNAGSQQELAECVRDRSGGRQEQRSVTSDERQVRKVEQGARNRLRTFLTHRDGTRAQLEEAGGGHADRRCHVQHVRPVLRRCVPAQAQLAVPDVGEED